MFKALRIYFARPETERPRKGRGWRILQLFSFEFVVVLLGVLAAQILQDWFSNRKEAERAGEAVAAFDNDTKRFASTVEYRLRAHDCEIARLARLGQLIRSGGAASLEELATPLMPMPLITEWSEDTRRIVAKHSGGKVLQRYDGLRLLAGMMSERQRQLEDQWADFRLMAPSVRNAADRDVLALAAARSEGLLSAIDMNALIVRQLTREIKADQVGLQAIAKMSHPCAAVAMVPTKEPGAPKAKG